MLSVVIRTDASTTIGTGHVMRCLTLAESLNKRGAIVRFVCRELDGHLCALIESRGFRVNRILPASNLLHQDRDSPSHATWLGATWQEDAEKTRDAIQASGENYDWLVVDHYAIDRRWESAIRASVGRIVVIDDLADRQHDCDLLLDQNLVAEMHTRYTDKVSMACRMLLGPEFALLQPIYAELHDHIVPREGPIRRILIYFGGADSNNLTGCALSAFLRLNRSDIEVDIVITGSSSHAEAIRKSAVGHSNVHLHRDLPTLATLMARADLAIGSAGVTSWERLCLGLPALVVTLAENQLPIAEELSRRELICWLGHYDRVDEVTIVQALHKLVKGGLDKQWSLRCLAVVDASGADRVCATLTSAQPTLRVRRAELGDEALLLEWANDPTTRENAFSPDVIPAATHHLWFRKRIHSLEECRLYIVETVDGEGIGQVRFERRNHAWEVDYAIAPMFRGRGLGRSLLETALLKFRSDVQGAVIFGQVKGGNHPSRRVFQSLGFEPYRDTGEVIEYRRVL